MWDFCNETCCMILPFLASSGLSGSAPVGSRFLLKSTGFAQVDKLGVRITPFSNLARKRGPAEQIGDPEMKQW